MEIYKTYLYEKFTRRTVEAAWNELIEKDYLTGFSCYIDRKKQYYYLVNDEPLTNEDFDEFIEETIEEIKDIEINNIETYLDSCIKNICYKRKFKLGLIENEVGIYNWLNQ